MADDGGSSSINQEDDQTKGVEIFLDIASLISKVNETEKPRQAGSNAQMLHKVPDWMLKSQFEKREHEYFNLRMVALGPFHQCERSDLSEFQEIKVTGFRACVDLVASARNCNKDVAVKCLFDEAKEATDQARCCYPEEITSKLSPEAFKCMMVLDGCFILHFIECANEKKVYSNISEHQIPLVIRDMFLLENQIPFTLLRDLYKIIYGHEDAVRDKISRFILGRVLLPSFYRLRGQSLLHHERSWELHDKEWNDVAHLLDILRVILLGKPKGEVKNNKQKCKETKPPLHMFGSVMELKDAGIRFTDGGVIHLTEITFNKRRFFPEILLPPITVTETTICFIMNMIAFEQHLSSPSQRRITSYTSFLNSVINHAEDVKELRLRRVLYHGLGSDEEVAELFNHWPIDAMGDLQVHRDVSDYISDHLRKHWKISIAEFAYTHFRSPWSVISLAAASFLLLLTLLQTIFTIKQSSD